MFTAAPHPDLKLRVFVSTLPAPLGQVSAPAWLSALLHPGAKCRLKRPAGLTGAVRDMLAVGGYDARSREPTRARRLMSQALEGGLPALNFAADAARGASLQSGFSISLADADRLRGPLSVRLGAPGEVLAVEGGDLDASGLVCLFDEVGPALSPARDAPRAEPDDTTTRLLSVIWGAGDDEHLDRATFWYSEMFERIGASTAPIVWVSYGDRPGQPEVPDLPWSPPFPR